VHDEDLTDIKEDLVLLTMAEALDPTVSQDEKTTTRSLKRPLETLVVSMGKCHVLNALSICCDCLIELYTSYVALYTGSLCGQSAFRGNVS
jgi:hypothetical protein